jgi:hypothetical protein
MAIKGGPAMLDKLDKLFARYVRQQWIGALALCLVLIVIIGGTAYALAGDSVDSAWVGVVGTALGGLLGFMTSWLVHRSEREERVEERLRAEKRAAYTAFLRHAEDSFHRFERLATEKIDPAQTERDKTAANRFLDDEVVLDFRVLEFFVDRSHDVGEAAHAYVHVLRDVRKLIKGAERLPAEGQAFKDFDASRELYRAKRKEFTRCVRDDLGQGEGQIA